MVNLSNLALAASSLITLALAAPTEVVPRQFQTGVQNNTQEFIIKMFVTDGDTKYTGWSRTSSSLLRLPPPY
jgi:hypothetical protein